MPLLAAIRDIKNKTFAPIYVLYGMESFLRGEFLHLLHKEMIDPTYADLNVATYDCTQVLLENIILDAETMPFLGEHRLVIADQAFFLTGAKPPTKLEVNLDPLLTYMENPSPYTSLVLVTDADKLDERKKLVKSLQQKAIVIPFVPLKDTDLYAWMERQAKKYKVVIERSEAALLAERVGSDLRLLDKEIEKMALYLGKEGAQITIEVINLLASRTLEQNVFSLVEDVVAGRLSDAFRTLYDCLKMGEEPIKLMALMARQFRMLLHVKMWAPRGYTQQQLAGMLKVHPFAVKKALEQARHFDEAGLRRLLGMIAEEDFRMKSGQVEKRLALELFITRVAQELKR